jgi:hypothetical protein
MFSCSSLFLPARRRLVGPQDADRGWREYFDLKAQIRVAVFALVNEAKINTRPNSDNARRRVL